MANDEEDAFGEAVMSKGRRMGREYTKIITLPDYADAKKYVIETLPAYV